MNSTTTIGRRRANSLLGAFALSLVCGCSSEKPKAADQEALQKEADFHRNMNEKSTKGNAK